MKTAAYGFAFLAGVPIIAAGGPEHSTVLELMRGGAVLWIFSAVIQALPELTEKSGPAYAFAYRFLHLLGANLNQAGLLKPKGDQ